MSCGRKDLVINFEITKVHNKSEGNNENKIMKAKEKLCKHSDQTKPEKFKNRKWFSVFQNNVRGVKEEKVVVQQADFLPEDFIERFEFGPLPTDKCIRDSNACFVPIKEIKSKKDKQIMGCIKCLQ